MSTATTPTAELNALTDYPENFLLCRTFGHSWKPRREANPDNPNLISVVLSCRTCGCKRIDQVSRITGYVTARRYDRPDGYLRPKGAPRLGRTTFRLQFVYRGE